MHKAKIDVPVLLIFFCRPGPFSQTFAAVKKACPSKLFLYQDGPREGRPDDAKGIAECRAIAEDIDWECEVHKFYQGKNVGCDPSEYVAQKWAFEYVDRCIILEDDDVADQSFFPFCKELLERYKDDERIGMICGMNHLGRWSPEGNSYFFSDTGPIWGWATWKRIVDSWEPGYDALNNTHVVDLLCANHKSIGLSEHLECMRAHKTDGRAFYETILGLSRFTQHRLCIIPEKNLIRNLGNLTEATHPTTNKDSWIYRVPLIPITFPLRHPKYVMDDVDYSLKVHLKMEGNPNIFRRLLRYGKRMLKRSFAKQKD